MRFPDALPFVVDPYQERSPASINGNMDASILRRVDNGISKHIGDDLVEQGRLGPDWSLMEPIGLGDRSCRSFPAHGHQHFPEDIQSIDSGHGGFV